MARVASQRSPLKRGLIITFKTLLYGTILGLIALVVAVAVAMSELPSYGELVRRDNLGQTIRVRAADGSVLISSGPEFGNWLRYQQIPTVMKDAMIAVEDRRFRYHPGVDPVGIVRGIGVSFRDCVVILHRHQSSPALSIAMPVGSQDKVASRWIGAAAQLKAT